jgi:ferric-dicitrate binding protein FerR (iron transport regulator)
VSRQPAPSVEPLSRAAWERVEARLFERLARGEHLGSSQAPVVPAARAPTQLAAVLLSPAAVWLGAAFAAAAALALWLRFLTEPVPSAALASALPAPASTSEPAETHIATTDAPTRTTLGGAALTLAARSEVRVAGSDAGGWLVRLARGQVDCEVAPRHGRPPFVVLAGSTRVTVVGTRFTVIQDGPGARVHVSEGRVKVASGGEERTLGPGESWPSAAPPAASTQPATAEPRAADVLAARPSKSVSGRGKATRRQLARLARSTPASPAERFARAARLEAENPAGAIALYRKLAASSSAWAANALYAEARLELERGRRERAVALLKRYRLRHPGGSNAADVASLLERLGHAPAPLGPEPH